MPQRRPRTQARKDHKGRTRRKKQVRRGALTLAAAGTATTMAFAPMVPTPQAEADIIDTVCYDVPLLNCSFTQAGLVTNPLMQIVSLLYQIPFISAELPPGTIDVPIIGPIDINAFVPAAIGRFVWQYPFADPATIAAGEYDKRQTGGKANIIVGVMDGALAIGQAIPQIQSHGNWPLGVNNYTYALVRNGGRSNGGLASRFDWLYSSIAGQTAVSGNVHVVKDTSIVPCAGGTLCQYIPVKLDVALGFDSINDFPVAPTAVSVLNSFMQSFLVTNYIGERENKIFEGPDNNYYVTIVPEDSALLEPIRFWGRPLDLIGIPFNPFDIIADIFEPAADILINIGYNDVDLTTYERSFDQFNNPNKQFWIDSTLTLDQEFAAVQAAISAMFGGIFATFGLAPAPAAAAAAPAAAAAASPSAAAVEETVTSAPPADPAESPGANRLRASSRPASAVADSAPTVTDDVVGTTHGGSANDAGLERTRSRADEQADTVADDSDAEVSTAQDNLDAAADQARARAQGALDAARDRVSTVSDQSTEAADQTSTAAPGNTTGDQASESDASTTSSAGGDAAA